MEFEGAKGERCFVGWTYVNDDCKRGMLILVPVQKNEC